MVTGNTIRLSKLAREFNVGITTIVEFLQKKGFDIDQNPNTKVSVEAVQLLEKEYKVDLSLKKESEKISLKSQRPKKEVISIDDVVEDDEEERKFEKPAAPVAKAEPKTVKPEKKEEIFRTVEKTERPKVITTIDLDSVGRPKRTKPVEVVKKSEKPAAEKVEKKSEPKIEKTADKVVGKQPEPKVEKVPEPAKPVEEPKEPEISEIPKKEEPEIGRAHV